MALRLNLRIGSKRNRPDRNSFMSIPPLFRQAGAEFIGTYALVTAGCGAIIVNAQTNALTHVGVALTFGLIITVMIAATGHISGAHFNPSVTLAFALIRRLPWRVVPVYVLAQLSRAHVGRSFCLFFLTTSLLSARLCLWGQTCNR